MISPSRDDSTTKRKMASSSSQVSAWRKHSTSKEGARSASSSSASTYRAVTKDASVSPKLRMTREEHHPPPSPTRSSRPEGAKARHGSKRPRTGREEETSTSLPHLPRQTTEEGRKGEYHDSPPYLSDLEPTGLDSQNSAKGKEAALPHSSRRPSKEGRKGEHHTSPPSLPDRGTASMRSPRLTTAPAKEGETHTSPPRAPAKDLAMETLRQMSLTLQAHQKALADREEKWAQAQEMGSRKEEDSIALLMENWRRERQAREVAERAAETAQRTRELEMLFDAIPKAAAARLHAQELDWEEVTREGKDPFIAALEMQPPSPPDDHVQLTGLLQRAAATFQIPLVQVEGPTSYLLEKLSDPMRLSTCLPVDPHIWAKGLQLMARPASVAPTNDRQERKYRAPMSDPLCLRGMPPADPAVVEATTSNAPAAAWPNRPNPPPRPLDTLGQKICTTAALAIREANATAVLARYHREIWDSLEPLLQHLPEEHRRGAQDILSEGRLCANHGVKMALDSADTAFRSMAHGVSLRRRGWLQGSGVQDPARTHLMNLPFDGQELFGDGAGSTLARPLDCSDDPDGGSNPRGEHTPMGQPPQTGAPRRTRARPSRTSLASFLGFRGYAQKKRRAPRSTPPPAEEQ